VSVTGGTDTPAGRAARLEGRRADGGPD